MNEDYGRKIGNALRAVQRMHSDTSRLLQDCDGTIGKGKRSIFGNYATRNLTYSVDATQWMAEAVYRWYECPDAPGRAEAVMVVFFCAERRNDQKPGEEQPLLLLGQAQYHVKTGRALKGACKEWDLWDVSIEGSELQEFGRVAISKDANKRIEWLKFVAIPLYSVTGMDVVVRLMEQVRQTPDP